MGGRIRIRKREAWSLYKEIKKRSLTDVADDYPTYKEINRALRNANSKKSSSFYPAHNVLQKMRRSIEKRALPSALTRIGRKIEIIETRLYNLIVCLQPRLKRRFGKLLTPEGQLIKPQRETAQHFFYDSDYSYLEEDVKVEFIEDCFADLQRPKYGWGTKVTFMEDEPCDLDSTNPQLPPCRINSTQTTESPNYLDAQRRQTLEEFRSAAPVDCRIRYIC